MRLRRTGKAANLLPGIPKIHCILVPVCYPALAFLTVKNARFVYTYRLFAPAGMPAGSLANSSRTAYNRAVLNKSLIRLFLLALQRHRARVRLHTLRALFLLGIASAAWLALLLPGTSAPSSVYVKVCKDFRKWGCFRRLGAALSHGACPVIRWFCGDSIRDMKAGFHHLLPRSE